MTRNQGWKWTLMVVLTVALTWPFEGMAEPPEDRTPPPQQGTHNLDLGRPGTDGGQVSFSRPEPFPGLEGESLAQSCSGSVNCEEASCSCSGSLECCVVGCVLTYEIGCGAV